MAFTFYVYFILSSIPPEYPAEFYSLTGDKTIEKLVINDPIAFWDKSDFLIIEIVKE